MNKKTSWLILALSAVCTVISGSAATNVTILADGQQPQIAFAVQELQSALAARGFTASHASLADVMAAGAGPRIVLGTLQDKVMSDALRGQNITPSSSLKREGFSLRQSSAAEKETYWVLGADAAGTMYGGLELAEVIRGSGLAAVQIVDQNPYLGTRGIKFNCPLDERTPTYSNHNGESQTENVMVMWDMTFWKAYIDDLARFRYNCLSLWNLHPFPSMVRVPGYEKIALDDVVSTTGTRKMSLDEKITFWRDVMRYAKQRNVSVYVVTWNIFIPTTEGIRGEKGEYGLTPQHDNPVTTEYFRKSVKQMLLTYPDLAGIGLTAGERMPDLSSKQKETWAFNTYGQGVLDAAAAQPGRKITLIHRQHQTGADEIIRTFQPVIDQPDVNFLFSYKYAKAHVLSSTHQPFADGYLKQVAGIKTLWELRTDDNFYFRWGAPDYVREFIQNIPHEPSAGYYYGSDGYVWGREFMSKNPETPRQLEMDKHWYDWMLWGRLGYDPGLTDERITQILATHFPQIPARDLFTAWQDASLIYPITTAFHWGALDSQWYIEACFSSPKAAETVSGFHDVNRFITLEPHPGTDNISIPDYVKAVAAGTSRKGTTPIQVAQQLDDHADKALKILDGFPKATDKELLETLGDIRAMAYLGKYYGHKIRGATELALYWNNKEQSHQNAAIHELTEAAKYWERYTVTAMAQYINPIRLNRVGVCDWKAMTLEVSKDVEIARGPIPASIGTKAQ